MATTELAQPALDALDDGLRGPLVRPDTRGYEAARAVYNGMIDRRPGAIARCADVADVLTAVRVAREHDVLVSVRGGGHNAAGLGVCDGGLVIDLSAMRGVRVDPAGRAVGCSRWRPSSSRDGSPAGVAVAWRFSSTSTWAVRREMRRG